MITEPWRREEVVAIIDLFFQSQGCKSSVKSQLMDDLTLKLNRRAVQHDYFFRKRKDIVALLKIIEQIERGSKPELDSQNKIVPETLELFHNNPVKFRNILTNFNEKYKRKYFSSNVRSAERQNKTISTLSPNPPDTPKKPSPVDTALVKPSSHSQQLPSKSTNRPSSLSTVSERMPKYPASFSNFLFDHSIDPENTWAFHFQCNAANWSTTTLNDLYLSVRAQNRLQDVETVEALLNKPIKSVIFLPGMGIKTFEEIFQTLSTLVSSQSDLTTDPNAFTPPRTPDFVRDNIDKIYAGKWSELEQLPLADEEKQFLLKIQASYDIVGSDLLQHYIISPNNTFSVLNEIAFQMALSTKKRTDIEQLIQQIPPERHRLYAYGFIKACHPSNQELQEQLLECFGDEQSKLIDILQNVNTLDEKAYKQVSRFLTWCSFEISRDIEATRAFYIHRDRSNLILELRSHGATLQEVGEKLQITRERVRQIEKKICVKSDLYQKTHHTLLKISALRNGDQYISFNEVRTYLGEDADILLYLFEQTPNTSYSVDRKHQMFIIGDSNVFPQVERFVSSLPKEINRAAIPQILKLADEEHGLPQELVEAQIKEVYNMGDKICYRGRLSLSEMYAHVLQRYYPNGIHVYSQEKLKEFQQYTLQEYGQQIQLSDSLRALSVRIADIGVLCDRGTYKAKQDRYISSDLAEELKEYVLTYEYPVLLFNTLFSVFEEELKAEGITNRYYLQGVMKELYGDELYSRRDYISRDAEATSFYSTIIDYISQFNYPISKNQIMQNFPGVSEIIINIATSDPEIINYFGEYMHGSALSFTPGERAQLRGLIDSLLADNETHTSRELFSHLYTHDQHVLLRNYIRFHFQAFSVCEYLFHNEFQFDRPYIAANGIEIVRQDQQLLDFLHTSKTTKVEDLFDFIELNCFYSYGEGINTDGDDPKEDGTERNEEPIVSREINPEVIDWLIQQAESKGFSELVARLHTCK